MSRLPGRLPSRSSSPWSWPCPWSGMSPAPAADDVKIALVAPLSGRWARQGQLKKMGAEMAIEEINSQGGIKALGGAKIVLREADAGDSVEKAVSAAQRVLTREKISAGIGSWLSSFTLGVTEVAERLQVPWLSLSYADSITERGFKYTFQTSPVSSLQAEQALDLVTDLAKKNNRPHQEGRASWATTPRPPCSSSSRCARSCSPPRASSWWWTRCGRRRWPTPPPSCRSSARPSPTSSSTAPPTSPTPSRCCRRSRSSASRRPSRAWAPGWSRPEYVKTVGKEMLDNIQTVVAAHPLKGQEELVKKFMQRTGEPFMTQDPLCTYAHVWLIKEAIEQAKSADPKAIRDALAKIDLTSGPAATALLPGRIKFDERGRRVGAVPLIVQWQDGEPYTVVPTRRRHAPHRSGTSSARRPARRGRQRARRSTSSPACSWGASMP